MATQKQVEANRLNAQRSTGPRTVEGKARSAANALKFGIDAKAEVTAAEDPEKLAALSAEYMDRFQPATPEELAQVKILIRCDWLDTRLAIAEAQLLTWLMLTVPEIDHLTALGHSFALKASTLTHIGRRQEAARRSYRNALRELERLQSLSLPAEPRPEPVAAPEPPEPEEQTPKLGSFSQPRPQPPGPTLVLPGFTPDDPAGAGPKTYPR